MQNKTTGKVAPNAPTTTYATLTHTGNEVTYASLWAFINNNCGGSMANAQIVPLPNCKLQQANPVPFGYGGKPNGVRAIIQNAMLHGVKNKQTGKLCNLVSTSLAVGKPLGHSSKKPNCLLALLNGGYSPSSSSWGTPFIKLVSTMPTTTK